MRYIVAGAGRSGSHLVHEILLFIRPEYVGSFDLDNTFADTFIHTNSVKDLTNRDLALTKEETLLICRRRDEFSALISLIVARKTNEWFEYSNTDFHPFRVDHDVFLNLVSQYTWQDTIDACRDRFFDTVDIWFEDLISSDPMEKYICDLLGWGSGVTNPNGWNKNKNPRDYTKLITNYNELRDIYLSTVDKNNKSQ